MRLPGAVLLCAALWAQEASEAERQALRVALSEAGSSQVDFIRALEQHLRKYPQTAQRAELERTIAKTAAELRDNRRVLLYGERVLAREPGNIELLERVTRLLLSGDDQESSRKALDYARRFEQAVQALPQPKEGERGAAQQWEQRQILLGKSLVYQSRAAGNLGDPAGAVVLARRSFETAPSAESAREIARWLDRMGRTADAIPHLADAFMLSTSEAEGDMRAKDRERMGEWWRKLKGSEAGLGEELLAAYDRSAKLIAKRKLLLRAIEPNAFAESALDFSISGLNGEKLNLATLKGKVIVFDFWATWCGPCRAQQPLYEEVKKRFASNPDVVLLNVSTDENRGLVKPFLAKNGWNKTVYFEDGLAGLLRVTSIPTTVVFNRRGEVSARMNGYIVEKFVDMLSERIEQALSEK
jgi:thiol-disulfide isomerase/thioredoxin